MSVCAFPDENSLASRWPRDENDGTLADTVFDAIPTPLLVLDKDLRVVIANRCYLTFKTNAENLDLQAAHQRVMSVASVQQQLRASENGGTVELASYLSRLCEALAASMIGDERRIP